MSEGLHDLATVALPEGWPRRAPPPGAVIHDPEAFARSYDATTLVYDVVPMRHGLRLFLPLLYNLAPHLTATRFRCDGRPVAPRHRRFLRYETLDLRADGAAWEVDFGTGWGPLVASPEARARFRGRRVLYTMLKDDDLGHVHDWVLAHRRNHGTDAVLIADNGSTTYEPEALRAAVLAAGVEVAEVIRAPLPRGPGLRITDKRGASKFLQSAMLNIARDRFLAEALGVLILDVDELVAGPDGRSVYDAVAGSLLGVRHIPGVWRRARAPRPRHADHLYLSGSRESRCNPKYAVAPGRLAGRLSWEVHGLEALNRRFFFAARPFRLYHCNGINTSWKLDRSAVAPDGAAPDPTTEAFMARTFAAGGGDFLPPRSALDKA